MEKENFLNIPLKITLLPDNQTKRVATACKNLTELKFLIKNIFPQLEKINLNKSNILFSNLPLNSTESSSMGQKIFINNQEDYLKLLEPKINNTCNDKNITIKIFIDPEMSKIKENKSSNINFSYDDCNISLKNRENNLEHMFHELVNKKLSKFEENLTKIFENFSNINKSNFDNNSYLLKNPLSEDSMSQLQSEIKKKELIGKFNRKEEEIYMEPMRQFNCVLRSYFENRNFSFSPCDLCKKTPNIKYICLICENLNICEECELFHNHPVAKFKSQEFANYEDVLELIKILQYQRDKELGVSHNINPSKSEQRLSFPLMNLEIIKDVILNKFNSHEKKLTINFCQLKDDYMLNLSHESTDTFYIKQNSELKIPFEMENLSGKTIPSGTLIFVKNCRDIFFNVIKIEKNINNTEKVLFEFTCKSVNKLDNQYKENDNQSIIYNLEIHIFIRTSNLKNEEGSEIPFTPKKFKLILDDKNSRHSSQNCSPNSQQIGDSVSSINSIISYNEMNLNKSPSMFSKYSPEDTVSMLPQEKKEVLSEIIRKDLSTRDIREICEILDKYDWKLTEEALKEIK
jgi:hypothetical protein